jgi:hypothetical protein
MLLDPLVTRYSSLSQDEDSGGSPSTLCAPPGHLAMGLEPYQSIHHVHARLLECARPADITSSSKRLGLHQHSHLLTVDACRVSPLERSVGPIDRLFDQYMRIGTAPPKKSMPGLKDHAAGAAGCSLFDHLKTSPASGILKTFGTAGW